LKNVVTQNIRETAYKGGVGSNYPIRSDRELNPSNGKIQLVIWGHKWNEFCKLL